MQYWRNKYLISKNKKERKNWQGHGSAHGEEIKGGAALWGQRERQRKKEKRRENEREQGRESLAVHYRADVPFLIPPVHGFVPWPSRKWELGRQQLTKELWRIQLAINGQPQAFVAVAMETAQHHYSKITNPFLHFSSYSLHLPSLLFSPCPFFSFKVMSLFFSLVHLNRFFPSSPYTQIKHLYVLLYMKSTWSCVPWSSSCLCPVGSSISHDCQRGDSSTTGTFVQSLIRYWPLGIRMELWVIFFWLSHTVMSNITQLSFYLQLNLANHHGNRRCNCTFLFVCLFTGILLTKCYIF